MDQIATPVMVEIDRQPVIGAGQELGLSECAGPRPAEIGQLDVAALHDPQCRDQLAPEEGLAAGACHIGKSVRQEELSLFVAEIAFDAPQRCNDMAVDAIGVLHRGKRGGVLLQHGLARRDALAIDEEGHIVLSGSACRYSGCVREKRTAFSSKVTSASARAANPLSMPAATASLSMAATQVESAAASASLAEESMIAARAAPTGMNTCTTALLPTGVIPAILPCSTGIPATAGCSAARRRPPVRPARRSRRHP